MPVNILCPKVEKKLANHYHICNVNKLGLYKYTKKYSFIYKSTMLNSFSGTIYHHLYTLRTKINFHFSPPLDLNFKGLASFTFVGIKPVGPT